MFYIQENDKPSFLEKKLKIMKVKGNIIFVPIENKELKNEDKIAEKLIKVIKKNSNSKKIILSKQMKKQDIIVNKLNSSGMKIMNGKWLSEILLMDLVKYIIQVEKINNPKISILINDVTDIENKNINQLALQYKRLNIVTNHPEKFKKIEESLLKDYGINIIIGNNKKKSLLKSDIILNIDFPEELINKYSINDEAIILNLKQKIKINKKRFNGLIINDYEITYDSEEFIDDKKYSLNDIYESKIYRKTLLDEVKKQLKDDNVKIKRVILSNGVL